MLRFTYKLKVSERVTAKCGRHPRYNPEKEGRGAIKGACYGCFALYDLYQSRLALEAAAHKFQRLAGPWVRIRQPRKARPKPPGLGASAEQDEPKPHNI